MMAAPMGMPGLGMGLSGLPVNSVGLNPMQQQQQPYFSHTPYLPQQQQQQQQ
eukprot:CAMPEP_0175177116 /NCGR_PEP_ID=MMETSP0087-20121206/34199_1 /TAXON_ID=136419 /ORGANISM="Unknown Unknown, Strain D1" /LENGTH=51 /DNA_ID=CAMNT_0016469041 /DNA_START=41 /DNA_END=193 /DNA_ORIENTATION=-